MTSAPWSEKDERRIRELRETTRDRALNDRERSELRALRLRETIEAAHRRRAWFSEAS